MSERDVLQLDDFVAAHPWPERLLQYGPPREALWHFDLPCSAEVLWPYITDTSRFNRALEMPEMHFTEREGARIGTARYGGIRSTWIEEPWEWVYLRWLESVRVFEEGYAHLTRTIFVLEQLAPTTTRYYTYFGVVPRGFIGRIWTNLGMKSMRSDFERVLDEVAQQVQLVSEARSSLGSAPRPTLSEKVREHVATLRAELLPDLDDHQVLDRLIEFITTGDELDLYRIQVPALARTWEVDEQVLLRTCLHATRRGLLELSWDIVCPHCRGVREEARTLGDVPKMGACDVCDIDFQTSSDNAIEITFHVHPSVRAIPKRFFCSAEPSAKEHIKVQKKLAPDARLDISTPLPPGRYRLRLEGRKDYSFLDVHARIPSIADIDDPVWRASQRRGFAFGPDVAMTLENDTEDPQTFIVESARWLDQSLHPRHLFNFQEFRDLFSEQYLAADVQLSVGTQAILFTDMVGSTRFYARYGDPDAFAHIKRHFIELYAIVARHRGAVVKTLGDAVMAAFSTGLDAVKAAAAIHQCFHQEREDTPIRLRISLNLGPCIAVNLNSNIDYFGGTVNVAAKLQSCADAGQIAMSGDVYHAEGVRPYLDERNATVDESVYQSRALDHDVPVFCWSTFA